MNDQPHQDTSAPSLEREIHWFTAVLAWRFNHYFQQDEEPPAPQPPPPPNLEMDQSPYARMVRQFDFSPEERLVLILALMPHLAPQVLDHFLVRNQSLDRPYCEFGGWAGQQHGGFLPTLETAVFLLAGDDLATRLRAQSLFQPDHPFHRERILNLNPASNEPFLSEPLLLTHEALDLLIRGCHRRPVYSIRFPAHLMSAGLNWEDLVLPQNTMNRVEEIFTWIKHRNTILNEWGLGRIMEPGFRAIFYGPPGVGKTLTAGLMGKRAGMDVYRVDLAAVISKYIGETEKNLRSLFEHGRAKNWILFFDEADALFARRTIVATANDRHGNQEVAYLLQSIETYPGVVILATNFRENLDQAFLRRFQTQVFFPVPAFEQRLQLWKNSLSHMPLDGVEPETLAAHYEVTGSDIANALRNASLHVLGQGRKEISSQDLTWALASIGKRKVRTMGGSRGTEKGNKPLNWNKVQHHPSSPNLN